jgi:uncharacterized protein DUF6496
MAKKSKKVATAFHEVFHNKPSTVDTSKSPEGQRKQMIAIALSKARAQGAKIPKGGNSILERNSMKGQSVTDDAADNLASKKEFLMRPRATHGRKRY